MGFITKLFSSKAEKIPSANDPEVEEARRKRRLAQSMAKGRQSTIVTGPGGVEDQSFLGRSVVSSGG